MENLNHLQEETKGKDTEKSDSTSQNFLGEPGSQMISPMPAKPTPQLHTIISVKNGNQFSQESVKKDIKIQSESNKLTTPHSELLFEVPLSSTRKEEDESFLQEKLNIKPLKRKNTPIFELPKPENEEGNNNYVNSIVKLKEIGEMVPKTPVEILEAKKGDPQITCYFLKYLVTAIRYNVSYIASKIIEHPLFESICLTVILTNCICLAIEDPTAAVQPDWEIIADYVFQSIYTAEIILKTFSMGFIFNEGAYLRNPWNIMDFLIVFFGYLSYLNFTAGIDLKSLRTFRVLRPLRTISVIEGLRMLIEALVSSLPLLLDILIILGFYFLILAIAGLQLWHGVLKGRCFNISTGTVNDSRNCGSHTCGGGDCITFISNPNYGGTHYDDVFGGLLTAFQCVTLESWSNVEQNVSDAFGPAATIYFTLHTLVGAFFLMNFMLAVIKSRVSKTYEESRKLKKGIITQGASAAELKEEAEKKMSIAQILKGKKVKAKQDLIENKMRKFI